MLKFQGYFSLKFTSSSYAQILRFKLLVAIFIYDLIVFHVHLVVVVVGY